MDVADGSSVQDVIDEIGRHGKVLDKVEFEANPFLQNVKFTDKTVGPYKFTHAEIGAYEPVIYKEAVTMSPSYSIPCIALFKDEAKSLAITVGEANIQYGLFIQNIIDFIIVAFCIFLMLKGINKLNRKKEETAEPAAPAGPTQEELLAEIRDLLKNK